MKKKIMDIKMLISDVDGVWTDGSFYKEQMVLNLKNSQYSMELE
jgi:3-deoxy-D-manno-octulosonate 8-phosphate phosphatase KdsC-like HAD superfamily phosphatase